MIFNNQEHSGGIYRCRRDKNGAHQNRHFQFLAHALNHEMIHFIT